MICRNSDTWLRKIYYRLSLTISAPLLLIAAVVPLAQAQAQEPAASTCVPTPGTATVTGWAGKSWVMIGAQMTDDIAAKAPFDMRYVYLAGKLPDQGDACKSCASNCTVGGVSTARGGDWWGCWQSTQLPPGAYVRDLISAANARGQIPFFTYYIFLQASGATEGTKEISKANDATFMKRYYNDFRFFLNQIGPNNKAIIHVEPDFWGYARQYNSSTPANINAAVATANIPDCGTAPNILPNTLAGMGQCLIAMAHKYAANARISLHASPWNISLNKSSSYNIEGDAQATANFLNAAGGGDLVITDLADRDADYYRIVLRQNEWWDATNKTLPNFSQYLRWVTALTAAMQKPGLLWQVPLGNSKQTNKNLHWKDNRLEYFFGHMSEVALANVVGIAYGAGQDQQTSPSTDGGLLVSQTNAYVNGGGTPACTQ